MTFTRQCGLSLSGTVSWATNLPRKWSLRCSTGSPGARSVVYKPAQGKRVLGTSEATAIRQAQVIHQTPIRVPMAAVARAEWACPPSPLGKSQKTIVAAIGPANRPSHETMMGSSRIESSAGDSDSGLVAILNHDLRRI